MKPGTLVMLRRPIDAISHSNIPDGAVGEVIEAPVGAVMVIGNVCVLFPRNISLHRSGAWQFPPSWLIPLSDGDIDLSEETEDSLNEEILLVD